jgi:ribose 5-phosphate isomerase A
LSATEDIEREKQRAAEAAADLVQDGMIVGVGTGTTLAYLQPLAGQASTYAAPRLPWARREHHARGLDRVEHRLCDREVCDVRAA